MRSPVVIRDAVDGLCVVREDCDTARQRQSLDQSHHQLGARPDHILRLVNEQVPDRLQVFEDTLMRMDHLSDVGNVLLVTPGQAGVSVKATVQSPGM